ncbi:hypothetical protein, partial [Pseudomonas viridiflava]|uniref:hypothetical protein n=1 Tax=Pseudomonas viridiflava TaxID=33069 RepID=UPI0019818AC7
SHSGADTPVLATAFAPPASFNFTMNQFDARQRYVEDVVAPPTVFAARQRYVEDVVAPPALDSIHSANFVSIPLAMVCIDADR